MAVRGLIKRDVITAAILFYGSQKKAGRALGVSDNLLRKAIKGAIDKEQNNKLIGVLSAQPKKIREMQDKIFDILKSLKPINKEGIVKNAKKSKAIRQRAADPNRGDWGESEYDEYLQEFFELY